ncbi:hypothetical protein, partial [Kribbella solani]|uniref:hypothetical protein n=1 Tax=Kribbella solani TaxID=236067 RepID=UPI0029BB443C
MDVIRNSFRSSSNRALGGGGVVAPSRGRGTPVSTLAGTPVAGTPVGGAPVGVLGGRLGGGVGGW